MNRYNKILILVPEQKMIAVENLTGQGKDDRKVLECDIDACEAIAEDERFSDLFKKFFEKHPTWISDIKAKKIGNPSMTICWERNLALTTYNTTWFDGDIRFQGFWSNGYHTYGERKAGWLILH